MGITEFLRRIWLLSANKIKSSESFSKQPTQLIVELNSSLRHIIVTNVASQHYIHELASASVHTRFVAFGMVISKPKGITSFLTSYWSRKCHKRIRYARQICRAVGTVGQGGLEKRGRGDRHLPDFGRNRSKTIISFSSSNTQFYESRILLSPI